MKPLLVTSVVLLLLVTFLVIWGIPQREPDLFINGKPYYTQPRCVQTKDTTVWEYHYGYRWWKGSLGMHWGWNTKTECMKYVIDTIEIK